MAFLVIRNERFALPIGDTRLGDDDDAGAGLRLPLRLRSVHATLSLGADGRATLRREGDSAVSVNGIRVIDHVVSLKHGDRIQLGAIQVIFGDIAAVGSTSLIPAVADNALAALAGIAGSTPTSDTGGRLVRIADGVATPIPADGLVIGRDPGCDIVLRDKGASRRHAAVRPSLQGYVVADQSVNGLMVNARRVEGAQVLGMGDVIRIGEEEFRFEADAASFEPDASLLANRTTEHAPSTPEPASAAQPLPGSHSTLPPTVEKPRGEQILLLATLEILNQGVHQGTRFRIERALTQVGRGRHCDVRLDDDSVSGSHATIMRRSVGWVVIDLESTNGTYVDGTRIEGEHALPGVCELRFGGIKAVFRPLAGSAPDESSTRAIVGVPDGPQGR